jgi:hypothetical protein
MTTVAQLAEDAFKRRGERGTFVAMTITEHNEIVETYWRPRKRVLEDRVLGIFDDRERGTVLRVFRDVFGEDSDRYVTGSYGCDECGADHFTHCGAHRPWVGAWLERSQ